MDFKFTDLEIPDDSPEARVIEEIMERDNVSAEQALKSFMREAIAERNSPPVRTRRVGPVRQTANPEAVIGSMQGTGIIEIAEQAIRDREVRYSQDR